MHWIDWMIAVVPLFVVLYFGCKVQRYISGVADFMKNQMLLRIPKLQWLTVQLHLV